MKIAVTGGNGELGRSLVPYLMKQGYQVVSIDRFLPSISLPQPPPSPDYLSVDVTNFGELVASISGCDAVIHLAAYRSPLNHPDPLVYANNSAASYNVLYAAAILGITRVCLASSVNAIGGAFSRAARYDYFPLDEEHPTYAEEPYALSKWVLEQQADMFARRYAWMRIASLRFHWIIESRAEILKISPIFNEYAFRHLWGYTLTSEANRACLLSITEDFMGHERFYIVAPLTAETKPSKELAHTYYPEVPLREELAGTSSFFDCSKAGRILGWHHPED